jgi:hypothetical protein
MSAGPPLLTRRRLCLDEIDTHNRHRDEQGATENGNGKTDACWDRVRVEMRLFDHDSLPCWAGGNATGFLTKLRPISFVVVPHPRVYDAQRPCSADRAVGPPASPGWGWKGLSQPGWRAQYMPMKGEHDCPKGAAQKGHSVGAQRTDLSGLCAVAMNRQNGPRAMSASAPLLAHRRSGGIVPPGPLAEASRTSFAQG